MNNPNCLVDDKPMEKIGSILGLDTIGHFALELTNCPPHNLGHIRLVGRVASKRTSEYVTNDEITRLSGLMTL